jgi:hypothetical protein
MTKKITLIALSQFLFVLTLAQKDSFKYNYTPVECKGEIPYQIKKSFIDSYKEDFKKIPTTSSSKQVKDLKEFYFKSNYSIANVFSSGGVLFGDELTNYVNKIARNLINTNKLEDLSFYVLKSSQVNAFCTANGNIFVTMGLLSQIENESQLAFTLAHEITHYVKKHSIESFVYTKEKENNYLKGRDSYENIIKNLSVYSQKNELESDSVALIMVAKAGYDITQAKRMIYVLEYSHLPFDEVFFDTNYFNDEFYTIPSDKFEVESKTDNKFKEYGHSLQTHPEYDERRNEIDMIVSSIEGKEGEKFLFSEEEFTRIRELARFENLKFNLLTHNYTKVFYEGYLLEKIYPENKYIKESMGKALYGIAKYKTKGESSNYSSSDFEGEFKKVYSFFNDKMDGLELSVLAIKFIQSIKGGDLQKYQIDLASDLYNEYDLSGGKFKRDTIKIKTSEKKDTIAYENMTKVQKIEYNMNFKDKSNPEINTLYYDYAFVNDFKKDTVIDFILKQGEFKAIVSTNDSTEKNKEVKINGKIWEEKSDNIEVKKMLAFNPLYKYEHRKIFKSLTRSEKKEKNYIEILKKSSVKNGIDITFLSEHSLTSISIEEYNRRSMLKECIGDLLDADAAKMIPVTSDLLDTLMKEYDTKNIFFSGIFSYKNPNQSYVNLTQTSLLYWAIGLGVMAHSALPVFLITWLRYSRKNMYYNAVYDTEKRKFILVDEEFTFGTSKYYNDLIIMNDFMKELYFISK